MRQKSAAEGHWFRSGAAAPIPIPLDTFLFKVASRCNLACPYCYVYELRDQSWQAQPSFMSAETHALALDQIRDHVVAHSIPIVTAIFHGGEPLLIGPRGLEAMAVRTRDRLRGVAEVRFGLQTNGTLFDERFLEVALRHQIRVGLSVDGPPRHHDRYRYQPNGLGSSERVEKTAALLRDNADAFGGILCVVNLDIDPSEVWDYLCGFRPSRLICCCRLRRMIICLQGPIRRQTWCATACGSFDFSSYGTRPAMIAPISDTSRRSCDYCWVAAAW